MHDTTWTSAFPITLEEVRLFAQPRRAVLRLVGKGAPVEVTLVDPKPMSALADAFGDCCEVQIIDLRAAEKTQLEFGRYRVELWNDDNPIAELFCDEYDVQNTDE
jgi:hypothetical protein